MAAVAGNDHEAQEAHEEGLKWFQCQDNARYASIYHDHRRVLPICLGEGRDPPEVKSPGLRFRERKTLTKEEKKEQTRSHQACLQHLQRPFANHKRWLAKL